MTFRRNVSFELIELGDFRLVNRRHLRHLRQLHIKPKSRVLELVVARRAEPAIKAPSYQKTISNECQAWLGHPSGMLKTPKGKAFAAPRLG
jgi:hypothetical protein